MVGARGVLPLAVLIAILALIMAGLAGLSWFQEAIGNTGWKATASCRAGPLKITLAATTASNRLTIHYSIQPPNPCYHVLSVKTTRMEQVGNTLRLYLFINATGPEPGEFCIQMLPPPVNGHISLEPGTTPGTVQVLINTSIGRGNTTDTYSCSLVLHP